mgnify:FL=1
MLFRSPGVEIAGSLVLMSIVKDAERIGDQCKNLLEASQLLGGPLSELRFAGEIEEFERYVREAFETTKRAFDTEDDSLAAEVIRDEVGWNKRFDGFFSELADADIPTAEAVVATLVGRALKRIQAHLSNIASSVVMPVHQIDHRPKHLRGKKGE